MEIIRLVVKDTVETRIRKLLADKHKEDTDEDGDESTSGKDDRLVGSIKDDKTELLLEEFDLLYGHQDAKTNSHQTTVKSEKPAKEQQEEDSEEDSEDEDLGYSSDEFVAMQVASL